MLSAELFAVPCLTVGSVHLTGLGIVDDLRPQLRYFGHPLLCGFDRLLQFMETFDCHISLVVQLVHVGELVFLQEDQSFGHLLEVELLGPPLVAGPLPLLGGKVNQELEGILFC